VKAQKTPESTRTGVQKISITEDFAGQRIDNFLRSKLPGVPKSRVYRLLRRGEVRVNGGRVKPEYKLSPGDAVRLPPVTINAPGPPPPDKQAADMLEHAIFEDKRLLVINKPAGFAVHGGSGISHGVIELLRASRPDLKDLALVHRLDRETSGCLVLAKRRSALRELHEKFREGVVEKNYLALAAGDWQHGDYLVDARLLVDNRRDGDRHVIVDDEGKRAKTRISLSRTFGDFSLLQCRPLTGRTHQIRVHAQFMGHPLVIDERYGDPDANRAAAKMGLRRLFLHAQSIAFPDKSGNELHFTAPLADDLDHFLTHGLRTKKSRRR
jgi:23S rRNA pseudouridine955/2504/2580 synthase